MTTAGVVSYKLNLESTENVLATRNAPSCLDWDDVT